ncbi:MAG: SUMF1/EgtB/PvdO family nonheme iron enzyme [Terracidiphilus sp.]|jgi:formylglycine-generating enzyme required for sulfatase activity/ankyrin repeat protein
MIKMAVLHAKSALCIQRFVSRRVLSRDAALLCALAAFVLSGRAAPAQSQDCALWADAAAGNFDVLAQNLAHCNNVDERNDSGTTPLELAISWNQTDAALLLLQNHADPNLADLPGKPMTPYYDRPLAQAVNHNNVTLAAGLIEAGANVNFQDDEGYTALYYAVQLQNLQMVQLLLDAHADPNLQSHDRGLDGTTPLGLAVRYAAQSTDKPETHAAWLAIVRRLLAAGADPNRSASAIGWATLDASEQTNNNELLGLLLASGARLDQRQPLLLTLIQDRADVARILIDNGAEIDWRNYSGVTALAIAAKDNDLDGVKLLLSLGADPDDGYNGNALRNAVLSKNLEMVRILLDAGANANLIADATEGFSSAEAKKEVPDDTVRQLLQDNWALVLVKNAALYKSLGPEISAKTDKVQLIPKGSVSAEMFHSALQLQSKSPSDAPLQLEVLELAQGLIDVPPVPAAALEHEAAGNAAYEKATTRSGILAAAAEYQQAVRLAPWVPAYYKNLCTLYLLGGAYQRAENYCVGYSLFMTEEEKAEWARQVEPYVNAAKKMFPPSAGTVFRDSSADGSTTLMPEMVVIPPGEFQMGSPESETGRTSNEGPQYKVTFDHATSVSKYPITLAEWNACVVDGACPSTAAGTGDAENDPVSFASWYDAQQYAAWLSKKTGEHYRLLTEAEYEYSSRAGTTTAYSWGDGDVSKFAVCFGCGKEGADPDLAAVGTLSANAWGLYDMNGNVEQWVEDCSGDSHPNYTDSPTAGIAWWNNDCPRRRIRGCSYLDSFVLCRSASRRDSDPNIPYSGLGLRVARLLR